MSTRQLPTSARTFTQRFSGTRRGARLARLLAVEQLRSWDVPFTAAEHAEAVLAELAANAVLHGHVPGRDFEVRLTLAADTLRIEVDDTQPDRHPDEQPPSPGGESGRGLLIVGALAGSWGVVEGPAPRKTVWAELPLGGSAGGVVGVSAPAAPPRQGPP
ncbi:ATP-binding protein [Streptomyces sp. TRM66268-LWL]|uniref:ATP-binding protein n=1 Tax=Streptomyces polyasparticus TaxID=2767826 RepID=A0ABR7SMU8_9ACTN|nr:ATP-binding protein [Streptomyces polyasparticus]MBC9716797.1 ATP-binding protein [Streptomyces polyasparticus]